MKTCHPFFSLLLAALLPSPAAAKEARPHIIFIYADDMDNDVAEETNLVKSKR